MDEFIIVENEEDKNRKRGDNTIVQIKRVKKEEEKEEESEEERDRDLMLILCFIGIYIVSRIHLAF